MSDTKPTVDVPALVARYKELMDVHPVDEQPKVTMEIVKQVADEFGIVANSARFYLTKEGAYVKKEAAKKATSEGGKSGGTRTSKAQAHSELKAAMIDAGIDEDKIDAELIEKMTGKAAQYFAEQFRSITK